MSINLGWGGRGLTAGRYLDGKSVGKLSRIVGSSRERERNERGATVSEECGQCPGYEGGQWGTPDITSHVSQGTQGWCLRVFSSSWRSVDEQFLMTMMSLMLGRIRIVYCGA